MLNCGVCRIFPITVYCSGLSLCLCLSLSLCLCLCLSIAVCLSLSFSLSLSLALALPSEKRDITERDRFLEKQVLHQRETNRTDIVNEKVFERHLAFPSVSFHLTLLLVLTRSRSNLRRSLEEIPCEPLARIKQKKKKTKRQRASNTE